MLLTLTVYLFFCFPSHKILIHFIPVHFESLIPLRVSAFFSHPSNPSNRGWWIYGKWWILSRAVKWLKFLIRLITGFCGLIMINHIFSRYIFVRTKRVMTKDRYIHLTCFLFLFIKKTNGAATEQFFSSYLCYSIWNINIIFILNRIWAS